MTVENPFPPDFKDRANRSMDRIDEIHRNASSEVLGILRSEHPDIVADSERLIEALDSEYPNGFDGDVTGDDAQSQIEYASNMWRIEGDERIISPYDELYRDIYDRYFRPYHDWYRFHPGHSVEDNPELPKLQLFNVAYRELSDAPSSSVEQH